MSRQDWMVNIKKYAEIFQSLQNSTYIGEIIHLINIKIKECFSRGNKLLLCGNGGFGAITQHIASEFMGKVSIKRNPLPAIALSSDPVVISCIANDFGYENIFSRQIKALGTPGDILITFSVSGTSKNILQALAEARRLHIDSFLLTGNDNHVEAKELHATVMELPVKESEIIQDVSMAIFHEICRNIELEWSLLAHNDWNNIIQIAKEKELKVLLLDRDGTINSLIPNGYVLSENQLKLNSQFLSVCQTLSSIFEKIIIVSNQSCISKGIISREKIDLINQHLIDVIIQNGGRVDQIYICEERDPTSSYRKPNIGMAQIILSDNPDIDFNKSIMVGDSYADELFAKRIGALYYKIENV